MLSQKATFLFAALLSVSAPALSYASEETKDPYEGNLLGSMGGLRNTLGDHGVDLTLEYKGDFWHNSGGLKNGGNYNDNIDLRFDIDGEKLFGIAGNKMALHVINNNGSHVNASHVGSVQGVDNIEAIKDGPKLYEAWVDQSFFCDKLSILLGLHDLNSEFMVTDISSNFIKPVMQMGQTFAQSGQNGPAVFPNTSLAARVKVKPSDETYVMGGVFNGIAGDPAHQYGNRLKWGGGALLVAEAGITPKAPEGVEDEVNKLAVGGWRYTQKFDDLTSVDALGNPVKNYTQGAYALASWQFYHSKDNQSLTAFLRPSIADGSTNEIAVAYEAGLVGRNWIPGRADSEIGIGAAQARNSDKYMDAVALSSATADRNEYSFEIYYRDQIYRGISIQPDFQYIVNPGTDPNVDNAVLVGLRLDINF